MAWITPKFSYNAGSGTVNFTPTYHAVQKSPVGELDADRPDSVAQAGQKQSAFVHIHEFLPLQFNFVPVGDLADWKAFMLYALTGGVFTFYPDSTDSGTHTDYTLEDTNWAPKWSVHNLFSFSIRLRKYVA